MPHWVEEERSGPFGTAVESCCTDTIHAITYMGSRRAWSVQFVCYLCTDLSADVPIYLYIGWLLPATGITCSYAGSIPHGPLAATGPGCSRYG